MTNEDHEIAQEILTYLVDHPDAQDTLEGIAEWWLLERVIKQQILYVEEALEKLVAENLVLPHSGGDTRTRYGINPQKRPEILELLRQLKSRSESSL